MKLFRNWINILPLLGFSVTETDTISICNPHIERDESGAAWFVDKEARKMRWLTPGFSIPGQPGYIKPFDIPTQKNITPSTEERRSILLMLDALKRKMIQPEDVGGDWGVGPFGSRDETRNRLQ